MVHRSADLWRAEMFRPNGGVPAEWKASFKRGITIEKTAAFVPTWLGPT
jgi:hypothetical protein